MSWVTPKTNWNSSDYFNFEDLERIVNNYNHLVDMANEIYTTSFNILFYGGSVSPTSSGGRFDYYYKYTFYSGSLNKWQPDISRETYDLTNVLYYFPIYLAKMYYLSKTKTHSTSRLPCGYTYNTTTHYTPAYYEYGEVYSNTEKAWQTYVETNSGMTNIFRSAVSYRPDDRAYYVYISASASQYYNQLFWRYYDLNAAEGRLGTIYNRFLSYL